MSLQNAQKLLGEAEQMAKDNKALVKKIKAVRVILARHITQESKARVAPNARREVHSVTQSLTK